MHSHREKFIPFRRKMEQEGLPEIAIKTFEYYYNQLLEGQTGYIYESEITPIETLTDLENVPASTGNTGKRVMTHTIIIKINGGLGTSMGLEMPKSLLKVRENLMFLDIIARQAIRSQVPLILMNSFATRTASLEALKSYPELKSDIPIDFLQHKVPKVLQADFTPVSWPKNPSLEWCPPGHGDIYTAMVTSGLLDTLIDKGYRYAFLSNADNLGAVLNEKILGYMVENDLPFLSEVIDRSLADKKGGHLARLSNGQIILRETAQCAPEDLLSFQDIDRHKYFNANNIWINLIALRDLMRDKNNFMGLTLIRNVKTVDPRDNDSVAVYQLETAMGSAIGVFEGASAIRVPRTRFSPVKTTDDLLAVSSDAYHITPDFQVQLNPQRKSLSPPMVELDPLYYRHIDQLKERFPYGSPSLLECERVVIRGDMRFGQNVVLKGSVRLVNETGKQLEVKDGRVLEGDIIYSQ